MSRPLTPGAAYLSTARGPQKRVGGPDGSDYTSIASAVQAVCDLKSHPAVLLWLVANEPNYEAPGTSTADAVTASSDVVAAVQAADPSRPCSVGWGGVPSAAVLSPSSGP